MEGPPIVNALSVDDDPAFQRQLHLLLSRERIRLLPSAATLAQGLQFAEAFQPDVVLLDISLDGEISLPSIPRFKSLSPASRIIVLTLFEEPEYREEALRQGAETLVHKSSIAHDLVRAILSST